MEKNIINLNFIKNLIINNKFFIIIIIILLIIILSFALSTKKKSSNKNQLPLTSIPTPILTSSPTPVVSSPTPVVSINYFIEPTIKLIENGIRKKKYQVQEIANKDFTISYWHKFNSDKSYIHKNRKQIDEYVIFNIDDNKLPTGYNRSLDIYTYDPNDDVPYIVKNDFWFRANTYNSKKFNEISPSGFYNIFIPNGGYLLKYEENKQIKYILSDNFVDNTYKLYTISYKHDNVPNFTYYINDIKINDINLEKQFLYDKTYIHYNQISNCNYIHSLNYYDTVLTYEQVKNIFITSKPPEKIKLTLSERMKLPNFVSPTIKLIENGLREKDNQVKQIKNKNFSITFWIKQFNCSNNDIDIYNDNTLIFFIDNDLTEKNKPGSINYIKFNYELETKPKMSRNQNGSFSYKNIPSFINGFFNNINDYRIEFENTNTNTSYKTVDIQAYNAGWVLYTITYKHDADKDNIKIYRNDDFNDIFKMSKKINFDNNNIYIHYNKCDYKEYISIENINYYDSVLSEENISYLVDNTNPKYK